MSLSPAPPLDRQRPVEWSLMTSSYRLPAGDVLASFKTSSKLTQVAARIEAAERGVDEALLLNTNGEVAEAAAGNLFWIYRDKVCTVPTGRGVLPGITRAVVLEICQNLGLPTNKRVIKPEALRQGDGIFLTQSAQGIIAITEFNGERVAQSPLVERIHQTYCEMLATE
jgi:branched-subunit amino acid aminotransferase/4-amino-4-deoxychorismate lyase